MSIQNVGNGVNLLRDQLWIEFEISYPMIEQWGITHPSLSLLYTTTLAMILAEKYSRSKRILRLVTRGKKFSPREKYLLCRQILPLLFEFLLSKKLISSSRYRELLSELSTSENIIDSHIQLVTEITKNPTLINEHAARSERDKSWCPCC